MKKSEIVREILKNNPWVSGLADFAEGDILAPINAREVYSDVTKVRSLRKLYELLRSFDGVFMYRDLVFVNHHSYGCFVYKLPNLRDYVEHLSVDSMSMNEFRRTIGKLSSR